MGFLKPFTCALTQICCYTSAKMETIGIKYIPAELKVAHITLSYGPINYKGGKKEDKMCREHKCLTTT